MIRLRYHVKKIMPSKLIFKYVILNHNISLRIAGFTNPFDACCGAGNRYPYGFNDTIFECSNVTESLYVCPNPINYISWDGTHYTDSFNFQVFNQTFLTGTFMYSI